MSNKNEKNEFGIFVKVLLLFTLSICRLFSSANISEI